MKAQAAAAILLAGIVVLPWLGAARPPLPARMRESAPASPVSNLPAPAPTATLEPVDDLLAVSRSRVGGPGGLSTLVDFSVKNAVDYLYTLQRENGSFRCTEHDDEAGPTALAVLALVSAGEAKTKPEIRKALEWLRTQDVTQTYSLGLRAAALSQFGDASKDAVLRTDVRKLMANMIDGGNARGLYTYGPTRGNHAIGDLSNSQYGVLGVWYAAEAGIEVPRSYWQRTEDAWTGAQSIDGGFAYRAKMGGSYGSMTAAGIATLAITHDFLHASTAGGTQGRAAARISKSAAAETDALAWLDRNFRVDRNPGLDVPVRTDSAKPPGAVDAGGNPAGEGDENPVGRPRAGLMDLLGGLGNLDEDGPGLGANVVGNYVHYMLFGYERVGEATGLTRFNNRRWYDAGARFLVASQAADGSWINGTFPGLVDTSYALLFLSRGRSPVVVQKLQFEGKWNNRTRDAASIVRWLRRESERHVNWQVANLDYPMNELRESPVLYAASDSSLNIPEAQWHTLKAYLDEGGLLLCADEGKGVFSTSVVSLFARLYPQYTFREVTKTHPFLSGNFPADKIDVPVKVLSNGIREIAVLLPQGDFPWRWQRTLGTISGKSADFALVGNILLNVTGRASWRNKGSATFTDLRPDAPRPRLAWRIAQIQHGGNWNPEPQAWGHMRNQLLNAGVANLIVDSVALGDDTGLTKTAYPLAHLTATHVPLLDEKDRARLRGYLTGGGVLLIDAAGGDQEVGIWGEELLAALVPGAKLRPIPPDHPIYAGVISGNGTLAYRASAVERVGSRTAPPRLQGLYEGDRLLAILATEDLTAGMVGYPHDGVIGYAPEAAQAIALNLLKWVNRE